MESMLVYSESREEEELLGIEVYGSVLKLRVRSNGNTLPEHFEVDVFEAKTDGASSFRIVVYRTEEDKGNTPIPEGVVIEFPMSEMRTDERNYPKSGDKIIVENLLVVA